MAGVWRARPEDSSQSPTRVARQVELSRADTAPADVHLVLAGHGVEHLHDVPLAVDAADVDRVDQRPFEGWPLIGKKSPKSDLGH